MGAVQSALALGFGMVGSMGALSPIGYIVPGIVIDAVLWLTARTSLPLTERMALTSALASAAAALTANAIVFRLWGPPLWLYLAVALTSGTLYGVLGSAAAARLLPVVRKGGQ